MAATVAFGHFAIAGANPVLRVLPLSTYVALGDSYASGEGNPGSRPDQWLSASGVPWASKDGCDRSPVAYPVLVAKVEEYGSSIAFAACSGAVTGSSYDTSSFVSTTTSLLLVKRGF